jgi:hypothetical protein
MRPCNIDLDKFRLRLLWSFPASTSKLVSKTGLGTAVEDGEVGHFSGSLHFSLDMIM